MLCKSSRHNMVPHLGLVCFLCFACLSIHHKRSPANCIAVMGKANKIKGVRFSIRSRCVFSFVSAETDCAGFLRLQFEVERCKPFPQCFFDSLCIIGILHHAEKIIRVAQKVHGSSRVWSNFLLDPQVKHIVQEDIGTYRTEVATLQRSLRCQTRLPEST